MMRMPRSWRPSTTIVLLGGLLLLACNTKDAGLSDVGGHGGQGPSGNGGRSETGVGGAGGQAGGEGGRIPGTAGSAGGHVGGGAAGHGAGGATAGVGGAGAGGTAGAGLIGAGGVEAGGAGWGGNNAAGGKGGQGLTAAGGASSATGGAGGASSIGTPNFVVRAGATTIGADGYSVIPVVILGTTTSGAPSHDTIVIDTSRPGAGSVSPYTVTLTDIGATVYFTPCNAAVSMWCAGPVQITVALASAPTVVLAQSQVIDLVAPTGIGSDSPCLIGGNVLFFNGDAGDYVFSGTQTVTVGSWSAQASTSQVHISVTPGNQSQGLWWDAYFDASELPDMTLMPQVYENAERWPFQSPGRPGLDISGDGRGCNTVTGRFQIEDLQMTGGRLTSFTATFEHHCEGGAAALRGCVHFQQ